MWLRTKNLKRLCTYAAFSDTFVTDKTGVQPRPQQAKPSLIHLDLCGYIAATNKSEAMELNGI